jgi:hypothetical protein
VLVGDRSAVRRSCSAASARRSRAGFGAGTRRRALSPGPRRASAGRARRSARAQCGRGSRPVQSEESHGAEVAAVTASRHGRRAVSGNPPQVVNARFGDSKSVRSRRTRSRTPVRPGPRDGDRVRESARRGHPAGAGVGARRMTQRTNAGAARTMTNSLSVWTANTNPVWAPEAKATTSTALIPPGVVAR